MKTDFILTYDKAREPDARILEALVSDIANCKMVVYDTKKFIGVSKIDKQTCLFLGEDCSSHLQFESKYDEYGIQIGWKGAKAWIRTATCSVDIDYYFWREQFFSEYERLYKKYDLELKKRDKISEVKEYNPFNFKMYSNPTRRSPVDIFNPYKQFFDYLTMMYRGGKMIADKIEKNRIEKELQNIKYNYATLLFVDQYIKPFLTEQPKDLLSEDE